MVVRQASGDQLFMRGFGERLRVLRHAYAEQFGGQQHTKARWARRLYVSPAMYGRWEAGKHLPKWVDLLRISVLFRVDPNYLVAGILAGRLEQWLYRALADAIPGLQSEADYWHNQSEAYERANRALLDAERKATAPSPRAANGGQPKGRAKRASPRKVR